MPEHFTKMGCSWRYAWQCSVQSYILKIIINLFTDQSPVLTVFALSLLSARKSGSRNCSIALDGFHAIQNHAELRGRHLLGIRLLLGCVGGSGFLGNHLILHHSKSVLSGYFTLHMRDTHTASSTRKEEIMLHHWIRLVYRNTPRGPQHAVVCESGSP